LGNSRAIPCYSVNHNRGTESKFELLIQILEGTY